MRFIAMLLKKCCTFTNNYFMLRVRRAKILKNAGKSSTTSHFSFHPHPPEPLGGFVLSEIMLLANTNRQIIILWSTANGQISVQNFHRRDLVIPFAILIFHAGGHERDVLMLCALWMYNLAAMLRLARRGGPLET
jgi:hypothetical protein